MKCWQSKFSKGIIWIHLCLITGCVSLPESSVPYVNKKVQEQLSIPENIQNAKLQSILQNPLSPASAMQLALLNSKKLHAELTELGVAESDILAAGLISNPSIAIGGLRPEGGGRWQLDFGISQSVLNLITRSVRKRIAQIEYEMIQMRVMQSLMRNLQIIEADYYNAIAKAHRYNLLKAIDQTAETTNELMKRFYEAGNISELEYITQKDYLFEQKRKLLQAKNIAYTARIKLSTQLGLKASQKFILPQQLYDIPQESFDSRALILQAKKQRLDFQILQQTLKMYSQNNQLIKNGIEEFEVGIQGEREFDGLKSYGSEFSLSLPIFHQGQARKLSLANRTKHINYLIGALELSIENDIQQIINNLNSLRQQLNILRTHSIPNSQRQVQLSLQEYNFMLVGIVETLSLKQHEYDIYLNYIELLNEYWQTRSALAIALGSALPNIQLKPVIFSPMNEADHSQHSNEKYETFLENKNSSHQNHGAHHD